nr:S9 family peptidase [Candidatus Neomarinimicrobiota bacterium]
WMDTGQTARLTNVQYSPGNIEWSPDGKMIAFNMFVKSPPSEPAEMPEKPEGAKWADPPKVIDKMIYRADGSGYRENGFTHIFTLPEDGGTPRQITSGDYHHGGQLQWAPDGKKLSFQPIVAPTGNMNQTIRICMRFQCRTAHSDKLPKDKGRTIHQSFLPMGKRLHTQATMTDIRVIR